MSGSHLNLRTHHDLLGPLLILGILLVVVVLDEEAKASS